MYICINGQLTMKTALKKPINKYLTNRYFKFRRFAENYPSEPRILSQLMINYVIKVLEEDGKKKLMQICISDLQNANVIVSLFLKKMFYINK